LIEPAESGHVTQMFRYAAAASRVAKHTLDTNQGYWYCYEQFLGF